MFNLENLVKSTSVWLSFTEMWRPQLSVRGWRTWPAPVVISEDLSTQFSKCVSTIFLVQKTSEFVYLVYKSMMK